MNTKKKFILPVIVLLVLLLAASSVTLAVYISQNYYNGVVVSGAARPRFSGDFLQYTQPKDSDYPMLARTSQEDPITLAIYNHPYGISAEFNKRDIVYDVEFSLPSGTTTLPGETYTVRCGSETKPFANGKVTFSGQSLTGKQVSSLTYYIDVPETTVVLIKATPRDARTLPPLYGKIQHVITSGAGNPVQIAWEGDFIYNSTLTPADYAAFNYQISGSGVGTYTLKWNHTLLSLDESFLSGVDYTKTTEGDVSSIAFHVDSGIREMYEIRFFRRSDTLTTWDDVLACVDVRECYVADSASTEEGSSETT